MTAKPPYDYLKKDFVSDIVDSSVPVAGWRKIKLAILKRQWFIFGWQLYQVRPEPKQQLLEDIKEQSVYPWLSTNKVISFIIIVILLPFRKVTTQGKCPVFWFPSQQNLPTHPFVCLYRETKQTKIGFQCELRSRCVFFQHRCVPGTRPSDAPLQRMLGRGVYGIICLSRYLESACKIRTDIQAARSVAVCKMWSEVTCTFIGITHCSLLWLSTIIICITGSVFLCPRTLPYIFSVPLSLLLCLLNTFCMVDKTNSTSFGSAKKVISQRPFVALGKYC